MPTPTEWTPNPMAETNERLARVETTLGHLSCQQDQMAQAVGELKESNMRLVAAVEQLLLIQNSVHEMQRETIDQDKRITQLESRISIIWSAIAVLSTALVGALVRAWMSGVFS